MTTRLARLRTLYETVERMKSAELRLASAEVNETASAQETERACLQMLRQQGWDALQAGNRVDWLLAETSGASSLRRTDKLRAIHNEREELRSAAEQAFQASRLEAGRMEVLVEGARAVARIEAGRREQSLSDDRFGSRLHWLRGMKPC